MASSLASSSVTLTIEVFRDRSSVTQGEASVHINGKKVQSFHDEIVLLNDGDRYYGPNIGGWASKTPDFNFINALLWHKLDSVYHISDSAKSVLKQLFDEADPGSILQ